jgi:hypothetical protein
MTCTTTCKWAKRNNIGEPELTHSMTPCLSYQISSSPGSGEYALAAILAPGAYARKPLFHRLAQLKMPTVFIYGDQGKLDNRIILHMC